MADFITRPGIVMFSLVFDIGWVVGLVGGLVYARRWPFASSRVSLWVLLLCALYGVVFQTWTMRMPPDFVRQQWIIPLVWLCSTTYLLGLSVGTLLSRR